MKTLVFQTFLFDPEAEPSGNSLIQELKRYTAVEGNDILNRKGQFWQHESYDRLIRTKEELENTIRYVLYNPVKAGLAENWKGWPYTYCKPDFIATFR